MPEQDLAQLLEKVIRLNKADSTIKQVYFNPLFAEELDDIFPALNDGGFEVEVGEEETPDGTVVNVGLRSPDDDVLDLGTVILTGVDVVPEHLTRISDVIDFVETSLNV